MLTSDNVRIIRPGHGLPPKFFDQIIGKRFNQDFSKGTPLSLEMLMSDE
jgi:N-acetylneuraminate synthase